jgi:hypothetical protein
MKYSYGAAQIQKLFQFISNKSEHALPPPPHNPQHARSELQLSAQCRCGHQCYNNSTPPVTAVMWQNFTLWQLLLHLSFVPQACASFTWYVLLQYTSTATVHKLTSWSWAFIKKPPIVLLLNCPYCIFINHTTFYTSLHKTEDTELHQPDQYSLYILKFTYQTEHELTLYTNVRQRFE